jgi:hypothetical protein
LTLNQAEQMLRHYTAIEREELRWRLNCNSFVESLEDL